ncbi:MAG TPA: 4'-phosphopantetheinyl transferase superfamily protein [Rhodanobacteraceae bacterium]
MTDDMGGGDVLAFAPAQPSRVAPTLTVDAIHLWWLPYRHGSGRAPLRQVLATYLDHAPESLRFIENAHGRPVLADHSDLDFNWSHSGEHAMIAVARRLPELGVDIEQERPRPRVLALAQRFFAKNEYVALCALPEADRLRAFIQLWTAKEAVLKAHGHGLAYGMEHVAFTLHDDMTRPHRFVGDIGPIDPWHFRSLLPASHLSGTLAWRGSLRHLQAYRLLDED